MATSLLPVARADRYIRPLAFSVAVLAHGVAAAALLPRSSAPAPEVLPTVIEMISEGETIASAGMENAEDSPQASADSTQQQQASQESLLGGVPDDSQLASRAKPQEQAPQLTPPLEEAKTEVDAETLARVVEEQRPDKPTEKPPEKTEEKAQESQTQEARIAPVTTAEGSDVQRAARDGAAQAKPDDKPASGQRGKGGDSARDVAMASYGALISAELNKRKTFPAAARASGARGTVLVEFTIDAEGRVAHHKVVRSSGFESLDGAAREMFARAPFPRPPRGAFTASVPIRFEMR